MKKIMNILLIVGMSSFTLWMLLKNNELGQFREVLKNVESNFIGLSVLSMVFYVGLEAIMLHLLINSKGMPKHFWVSFKTTVIGQYYSLITPFASGGQPMQLFSLMKDGLSAHFGTAVLVNKFLVFQIGITLYSLALVFWRYQTLIGTIQSSAGFVFIGLGLNTLGLSGIVLLVFNPKVLKSIMGRLLGFIHGIRKLKSYDEKVKGIHIRIDTYTESIRYMLQHRSLLIKMSLLTMVQLTAYFSTTFFIYRALGLESRAFIDIIAIQAILYMSISFIPSPGTAGAAEGGFLLLFGSLFTKPYIGYAVLLWRGVSYYLNLIMSGLFTLWISLRLQFKTEQ